jgi:hypothetical protein
MVSRVLAFGSEIWHNSAVPVWLERFALVVLAAAFGGIVILNSLKMDGIQRTGIGIAIFGLSIYIAQTIHTFNQSKTITPTPPPAARSSSQEHLTLKQLFLTDFSPHLSRSRLDDSTLTIGSKSNKFPEITLKFTPQLYIDMDEGTQFLGFYIPVQDRDPEAASKKTVLLCRNFPDKLADLLKRLQGIQAIEPTPRGSLRKSTELPLSRQIYIYHDDFISPQDTGDLVREYESRQLLVEFRGSEYLAAQELLRTVGQRK